MVHITINPKFSNEKKYTFDILLNEILGIDYTIKFDSQSDHYCIETVNQKKLIIEDHFFSKISLDDFFTTKILPKKVEFIKSEFSIGEDVVLLFGKKRISDQDSKLRLGLDLIGSSFFMLSRIEEYNCTELDQHDRMPAKASTAFKYGFLNRPIVNEYAEIVWNILKHIGYKGKRKKRRYSVLLTHDVDLTLKNRDTVGVTKRVIKNFLRGNFTKGSVEFASLIKSKLDLKNDPYNSFNYIMNQSEKYGLKSYFFFMSGGTSSVYDNYYSISDEFTKDLINSIIIRNHKIGFHPSYNSYDDIKQFLKEKEKLEAQTGDSVNIGRQHYLRFHPGKTWPIWEVSRMIWDSTLSYADYVGFRAGICHEFSVFDVNKRKKLNLKEKPLTLMEKTLLSSEYMNINDEDEMLLYLKNLSDVVKKYNGEFVLLWHNQKLSTTSEKEVYEKVLETIV